MCFEVLIARQRLWLSAPWQTTQRCAEACDEGFELMHSGDSEVFFKALRMFLRAVQNTQDASHAEARCTDMAAWRALVG